MELLSAEEFRQKLAGLAIDENEMSEEEEQAVKSWVIQFYAVLPKLFSEDFDRKTMWERIGNGMIASVKKSGGDYEQFINLVLDYIKAEPAKLAASLDLQSFLEKSMTQSKEWQKKFLQIIERKNNILLVYGRQMWKGEI